MGDNDIIKVEIDDFENDGNQILKNDFDITVKILEKKNEINRKNKKDFIRHFIAGLTVITFVVLTATEVFLNKKIPSYFISTVSIIMGFYFAKEFEK